MFSILTPTFNREKELPRVFNSLKHQTFTDFEWVISDDGSTDETSSLVKKWQDEGVSFPIIYHVLSCNQGKSYAVNEGLALCNRPYTLIADSDDTFKPETLMELLAIWESIETTENPAKIGAIWTLVQDEDGRLIGNPWPKNFWQVGFKERVLLRKKPISGEKWHCWRTVVLKRYGMYTNANSHIGPGVTWNRINKDFDFLCVNSVHRTYWFTEDGIIHQKKSRLKIEKRQYYGAYLELNNTTPLEILRYPKYRALAFNYIKALFFFRDAEQKLRGIKLMFTILASLGHLPKKLLGKIRH